MENKKEVKKCFTCKHRGTLFNSCHSRCLHPDVDVIMGDHETLFEIMKRLVNFEPLPYLNNGMRVEFKPTEWSLFPFNFDPTWLISCNRYEEVV